MEVTIFLILLFGAALVFAVVNIIGMHRYFDGYHELKEKQREWNNYCMKQYKETGDSVWLKRLDNWVGPFG